LIKKNVLILVLVAAVLLSGFITGCGIPQQQYDKMAAQYSDMQAQVTGLRNDNNKAGADLSNAQMGIMSLQGEIDRLREQYEIVGDTTEETAKNIVKKYNETHVYSQNDFFICSNMALDVWNMLKAQQLNAVIRIGSIDAAVSDIAEANHAWVLAEVADGQYLALETTGGYAVKESENPLYYQGWTFASPKEYKEYEELRRDWNIRAEIINDMSGTFDEVQAQYKTEYACYEDLINEFNSKYAGKPVTSAAEDFRDSMNEQLAVVRAKEGRTNQLKELMDEQNATMKRIVADMSALTS